MKMKAIVQDRYGSPAELELREIDRPAAGDRQVLVRVHAAGVNPLDWHLVRGWPYFVRLMVFGPLGRERHRHGRDVAGVVEEAGAGVERLRPGDEVFGYCKGAFGEFVCGDEDAFLPRPARLTMEEAAAVPIAGLTALQALRDQGDLQPGQKVLIHGASGGVGTFAVQLARWLRAEVTGVCSTPKVEMVRSLGADHVIDYTREDFTQGGRRYDLILDNVGNRPLSHLRHVLTGRGTLVLAGGDGGRWTGGIGRLLGGVLLSPFVGQRIRPFVADLNRQDLSILKELIDAGKVTPIIDRTYPLAETPRAILYVEGGHARGKVVITVKDAGTTRERNGRQPS